jgi:hypothetical protein
MKARGCDWHKPHGLGYLDFFQWADEQTSKGHEQKQCEDCQHWYFPEQFGQKPKDGNE